MKLSEYKERQQIIKTHPDDQRNYFVAHLKDGSQINEHQTGWANVPLHDIVMLELNVQGNKWLLHRRNLPPTFVEFTFFKTEEIVMGKNPKRIHTSSIGWHDGITEYIITVDAVTGIRFPDITTNTPPKHLHPHSKLLLKNQKPIEVL